MIDIPTNILTLLKSRQQIGDNRPTGYIEIGGMPAAESLLDPTSWTNLVVLSGTPSLKQAPGNIEETTDGRAIIAYIEGNTEGSKTLEIAYADSVVEVLNQTKTFGAGTVLKSNLKYATCSISRINGKLYIIIGYLMDPENLAMGAECWLSETGNGDDFVKISDISTDLSSTYELKSWNLGGCVQTRITKLANGNLACILVHYVPGANIGNRAFYSDDGGETWTMGAYMQLTYVGSYVSYNAIPDTGGTFYTVHVASTSQVYIGKWTNSGANFELLNWGNDWLPNWNSAAPTWSDINRVGDKWYIVWATDDGNLQVRRFAHEGTPNPTNMAYMSDWDLVVDIPIAHGINAYALIPTSKALVCQRVRENYIEALGTLVNVQKLQPKRIVIQRSKGSASQLTVQFENTGGKYAPDPAGPWYRVMWPNNTIKAFIGYGTYLPQAFSGLIDDLDMETFPQYSTIQARDRSKMALDQMCQWTWDGVTYYDGAWASQDPEGIAVALFTMAGFAEADIIYDVTGMTIPEFKFNQQTYADLLQKLAEMAGCEWYCDEDGKGYFKLVTYPAATPAYEFVHGVDIFSLRYRISDSELYRWVVVTAQGPEDEDGNSTTVSATVEWSAADYYGLPPHKTLYVTASDLVQDEAGCLEIANRLLTAMTTKARQVQFVAVGIPNVQMGDCIQVTEASTTISEIYRVFDFEHQYDAEGSPVFATVINCYWYAHG